MPDTPTAPFLSEPDGVALYGREADAPVTHTELDAAIAQALVGAGGFAHLVEDTPNSALVFDWPLVAGDPTAPLFRLTPADGKLDWNALTTLVGNDGPDSGLYVEIDGDSVNEYLLSLKLIGEPEPRFGVTFNGGLWMNDAAGALLIGVNPAGSPGQEVYLPKPGAGITFISPDGVQQKSLTIDNAGSPVWA